VVVAMDWWTCRGKFASDKRTRHEHLLVRLAQDFGRQVLHIFDRGFAGSPWLAQPFTHRIRFMVRWPRAYRLFNTQGQHLNAWQLARGKRSCQQRYIWDARRQIHRKVGFLALEVAHPDFPLQNLWLVIS
jgi:hypothetical protein